MIIVSLNCQGLGQSLTVHHLTSLVRKKRPFIVFLLETRMKDNRMEKYRKDLGFKMGFYVNPLGKSGGLGLWWGEDTKIDILSASKNLIDTRISNPETSVFRGSWFYGPPDKRDHPIFWDNLDSFDKRDDVPWLCMRDFNDFLWCHEKDGGQECSLSKKKFLFSFHGVQSLD